jgi:hypothetical protein
MDKLIQTGKCSIIYGNFHGKPNQELFRCSRELDDEEIPRYVNENRCLLGFEADTDTENLTDSARYAGYFRLYFCGRWYGRWMESKNVDDYDCAGVANVLLSRKSVRTGIALCAISLITTHLPRKI